MNNFKNLRYNSVGGIDGDIEINGESAPYTLTLEEIENLPGETRVAPADSAEVARVASLHAKTELFFQLNSKLESLAYEFPDGKKIQVREQDLPRLKNAVADGSDIDWLMEDNRKRLTTASELKLALNWAIAEHKKQWATYVSAVDKLNSDRQTD